MATVGYLDIGAVQRIESGSETSGTGYLDVGAVQRQEAAAGPSAVVPVLGGLTDRGITGGRLAS